MKRALMIALWIALAGIVVVVLYGIQTSPSATERYQDGVARDIIDQYEITKRSGSKMDICVRAGAVAETYLQAKNEAEYRRWQKIQKADCAAAGLPMD